MAFLAVDVNPTEDSEDIQAYKEREGYTWDMVPGNQEVLINYGVNATTKKYAVDRGGAITFKSNGSLKDETWERVFGDLAQQ